MLETPIRILIVDDHELVRRGLALVLGETHDLSVVGEAGTAQEAVQICQSLKPNMVLMDLFLPDFSGVEAIRKIHDQLPEIKIIALSTFFDEELMQSCLRAGAIGYLTKNTSTEDLLAALRQAASGRSVLSPDAAHILINATYAPFSDYQLTTREQEVLSLMAQGLSNQQIAQSLSLSISTVKKHAGNIFNKLNCTSRSEAIVFALQNNLVS